MRVTFVCDRLSARGGADRHLLGILDHLQPLAQTMLLAGRDDLSLPVRERARLGPWRRIKGLDRSGLSPRGGQAALKRLTQALAQSPASVIHAQNIMDPALLAACAATGRAVCTVQDHRFFCPGLGKLTPEGYPCAKPLGPHCLDCFGDRDLGRRMLELTRQRLAALSGMARVLTLSQYMADELKAAGLPAQQVGVIPPFVHALPARPPAPAAHHLLACRLVERKGVRVALAAARLLKNGLPLLVAGDGPLAGEVATAAAASSGRLRYVGWADRETLADLLAASASLWLPSLWAEPYGIAGVEALSRGVPVAASAVGGVEEWLARGRGGLLIKPGDPQALASAADELAGPRGREMGRAGAAWVAGHLRPQALMARLWDCYEEAAANGSPA